MTDKEEEKESPAKEEDQKPRSAFRKGLESDLYLDSMGLLARFKKGERPITILKLASQQHPWVFRASTIIAFILYAIVVYAMVNLVVVPLLIPIYDFTTAQAVGIGIQLEANLLSTGLVFLVAYFYGKRKGKKEAVDYGKLAEAIASAIKREEKDKR